ncbi:MAG: hypothetical protein IKZ82_08980, partial [Clostridia bacterium]|nr:hypothetical protein [Clostridia bacterium]
NVSNLLKHLPNSVIRAQFVQNELKKVDLYVEVDKSKFDAAAIPLILDECRHTLGSDMQVEVHVVDEIPRAASGKYRFIINNLAMSEEQG